MVVFFKTRCILSIVFDGRDGYVCGAWPASDLVRFLYPQDKFVKHFVSNRASKQCVSEKNTKCIAFVPKLYGPLTKLARNCFRREFYRADQSNIYPKGPS